MLKKMDAIRDKRVLINVFLTAQLIAICILAKTNKSSNVFQWQSGLTYCLFSWDL